MLARGAHSRLSPCSRLWDGLGSTMLAIGSPQIASR